MDHDGARAIALRYIDGHASHLAGRVVIVDRHTIETPTSWVFFYQSREYVGGGDWRAMLCGNRPIEVGKGDGAASVVPLERLWELQRERATLGVRTPPPEGGG